MRTRNRHVVAAAILLAALLGGWLTCNSGKIEGQRVLERLDAAGVLPRPSSRIRVLYATHRFKENDYVFEYQDATTSQWERIKEASSPIAELYGDDVDGELAVARYLFGKVRQEARDVTTNRVFVCNVEGSTLYWMRTAEGTLLLGMSEY
jgi:hypothetical protein